MADNNTTGTTNQDIQDILRAMELLPKMDQRFRYFWDTRESAYVRLNDEEYLELINKMSNRFLEGNRLDFAKKLREFLADKGMDIDSYPLHHGMIRCLMDILSEWKECGEDCNNTKMSLFSDHMFFFVCPALYCYYRASAALLLQAFCEMASSELIERLGCEMGDPQKESCDHEIQNIFGVCLSGKEGGWRVWKEYRGENLVRQRDPEVIKEELDSVCYNTTDQAVLRRRQELFTELGHAIGSVEAQGCFKQRYPHLCES